MEKITFPVRTFLIVFLLLGSSLTFLTAKNKSVAPVVTGAVIPVSCFNGNNGSIDVTISGAVGNYSVSWTGINSTSEDVSNLSAGNYTIIVTDSENNSSSETFQVVQPTELILQAGSSSPVSCHGGSDGIITAGNVSGGNGSYQYSINGTTFQNSNTFSGLTANTYNLTVKDSKNCTVTQTIEVNQPDVLTMDAPTSSPVSCNGGNDGSLTAGNVSGGNGSYQYSINGTTFQNSNIFSGLTASTYILTVKDSKNCSLSQSIELTQPDVLTMASPTSSPVSCNGGNDGIITAGAVSGGNGGYQYSIDGTNFSTSNSFSGLTTGNFTLTIKDANGCTYTETATVSEPSVLIMAAPISTPVSCNGGSDGTITAGAVSGGNGGYQYSIDGTNFSTSNSFSGLTAGTYTITVKDSKGCTDTKTATVSEPGVLTIAAPTSTPVSCNGGNDGTITAGTVTGGNGSFQYKLNTGTYGTSNFFSGVSAGTHIITVKDSKGCETSQSVTVIQPDPLVMAASTFTPVSCNGENDGTATAGATTGGSGGYKYSIDGTNFTTSDTFSNLIAGSYTITVKDSKNCLASEVISVTQPNELTMTDPTSTPVTCFGASDGTITAGTVTGGNGGYLYSVDNTNLITTTTFTGLSAGTHTIFVKDDKGCSLQKTVTVTAPAILTATVTKADVSCFGGNNGTITLSGSSGGSGTYEYRVNTGTWQTSNIISGLVSGTYNVQIRDKNVPSCGIVLNENLQLNQPAAPITVEVSTTRTTTYGTATGSATANPSGGSPGYTYEWRKENETTILHTTKTVNNFPSGNYILTVLDSRGCRYEQKFTIIDALQAFIVSKSICESNGGDTDIRTSYFEVENLTAVGGVAPYSYSWNFGDGSPIRTGIGEHQVFFTEIGNKTVTLTVKDVTGKELTVTQSLYVGKCYEPCGKSENIVFNPNNFYVGDSSGKPIDLLLNCQDNQNKYIYLKVDKSANAYNPYIELVYLISNKITGTSNPYFVKGCRVGDNINDDPNDNKVNKIGEYIRFTINPISFKCGDDLSIDNFYITWTNVSKKDCGQNNNAFCYSIADPLVLPTPLKAEATANKILCKGDTSGIINVKVSGGFAPYTYSLTETNPNYQTNSQFINNPAGNYTIYVKDARGNKTTASVSIIQPSTAISTQVVPTPPKCFGEMGAATVTGTGGTPFTTGDAYKYLWNDPAQQTTATATGLVAGNYTVTVIDANGCQTIQSVIITQPEQLTTAEAGENQIFKCGFNTTTLEANVPVTGTGSWSIISGTGGNISETGNATSIFTGTAGSYTLRWTISHTDGSCASSSDVTITYVEDCSKLDFDGVDDHIIVGNNYGLTTGTFSIEAWVKLKSTTGVKTILSKRNSANLGVGGYDLIVNNGAPTFRWNSSSVSTSSKLGTERWYHIAVLFKDAKAQLYVDGINVGNSAAVNPTAISEPFLIGAMYNSQNPEIPGNYFHGWIEEVRIWNKALTEEQLRFMMNQRIIASGIAVKGTVLPMIVPPALGWNNLIGYYQLLTAEAANGITKDKSATPVDGRLKNIETLQENTAPLPYISNANGPWRDRTNWKQPVVWDAPNSKGINGENINWNIARINHDITSGGHDINVLGLLSESGILTVSNPNEAQNWQNSGQALRVSHYLKLNGNIILVGESQLIQTDIKTQAEITAPTVEFPQSITSVLEESSTGYIERAQQGTANSFNYNYWSSPVSKQRAANNSTYTVKGEMLDGSSTNNYGEILDFHDWHEHADYNYSNTAPRKISNYWINKFRGTANVYSEWKQIGSTGVLNAGEGYTMKGTSGQAAIADRQNYVFRGKPNNGTIPLNIQQNQNYLLGNPYPSAIDINKFILDNLNAANVTGATNNKNIFNGAVYFWDHFAGGNTHILLEYIGGYATRNLVDGVPAISNDYRVNANDAKGSKIPGQFIPVAQGFFINSVIDPEVAGNISVDGGDVLFKNSQRVFMRESSGNTGNSVFLSPEEHTKQEAEVDKRPKIRLDFKSPMGYYRQILVGVDENASNGFDLGYDALMNDYNLEDMYWIIGGREFVIQGVSNFGLDQKFPLGLRINEEGEVMVKINELKNIGEEINIFLKDKSNDTYYDLRESEAKLIVSKGEITDRFEIVFQKDKEAPDPDEKTNPDETPGEEPDPDEGTNTDPNENPDNILPPGTIDVIFAEDDHQLRILNPDELNIQLVEIFNLVGQKIEIFQTDSNLKQLNFQVQEHPSALYVVKVFAEEGMVSKNILIMK